MSLDAPCAVLHALAIGKRRVLDAKSDRANRRAVYARKGLRETPRLGVDNKIDAALPIQKHVLRAVLRDRRESHLAEESPESCRIGGCVFDELEAVGAERVVPQVAGRALCHGCLLAPCPRWRSERAILIESRISGRAGAQKLQYLRVQRAIAARDDRSAFVAAPAIPRRDRTTRGFDNRYQRLDVIRGERGLDDDVDEPHREQAIRVAVTAPARQPHLVGDAAEG